MDSAAIIIDHWSRKQIHNPTGVSIRVAGAVWKAEWMYQHLNQLLEQGISQFWTKGQPEVCAQGPIWKLFFKYIGKLVIVIDFNLIIQNVQILKVKNSKLRMCCFNVTII